jgi:hypothetical protein
LLTAPQNLKCCTAKPTVQKHAQSLSMIQPAGNCDHCVPLFSDVQPPSLCTVYIGHAICGLLVGDGHGSRNHQQQTTCLHAAWSLVLPLFGRDFWEQCSITIVVVCIPGRPLPLLQLLLGRLPLLRGVLRLGRRGRRWAVGHARLCLHTRAICAYGR